MNISITENRSKDILTTEKFIAIKRQILNLM